MNGDLLALWSFGKHAMQCNASAGVVPAGDGSFEEAGNCEDGSLVRGAFNF